MRCKINKGTGFWSAFWIQASNPYNHDISRGGIGGAEIDIFESGAYDAFFPWNRNSVTQTAVSNGRNFLPLNMFCSFLRDIVGAWGAVSAFAEELYKPTCPLPPK